jgi:PAS domain S-box-containing protein
LVFGDVSGFYTPNPFTHSVPGDFFSTSLVIISTAVMVRLITESLFRSNRQLQKELVERKLVEERIRLQAARTDVLAELSNLLAQATQDYQLVMDTAVRRCAELIGDGASIFMYSPDKEFLQLAAVYNPDPSAVAIFREEMEARPIRADEGAYAKAIRERQPVLVESIPLDLLIERSSPERSAYYQKLPLYSMMLSPLLAQGMVIGVIGLGRHIQGKNYTAEDLTFLQEIAARSALAIHNAQMYTELEQELAERKRAEQVQLASRKIAEAALTQSLDEFYQSVYSIISPLIPAKNFYITLYDAASNTFITPFLVDEFDLSWPPYHPGKGLGAYVLRTGSPLLTRPETFSEMEQQGLVEIIDHPMVEWLGVPLKTREGKIVGVMAVQNYSGQPQLGKADVDLLEFVSVQVAMAIERKQAEEALRKSEALYRRAIEVANAVPYHQMYHVDGESVYYDFIGEGIRKITGYGPDEFNDDLWDSIVEERILLEELAEYPFNDAVERVRSGVSPVWKCNHRIRAKDGSIHWVFEAAVELRDENGVSHGSIGTFQDITERKHAEEEREKLIQELTAKNAELERFTYTVSHDLKAPLVTINGFLGFLEKDAAAGNMERLKKDNLRIQEAVDKMQLLLTGLLELSRIGRLVNPPQTVAFTDLVQESLAIVQGRLDASRVRVTVQPDLPAVYGDRQRLVEVLQNLIDNAAKFMGDQPEPTIEIGCRENEGEPVFFVQDNGIGIDSRFHEQVFGLFNKLDPHVEGTGVGLALVKRIIEVHGGKIWVESEPGKGSTFFFTLA